MFSLSPVLLSALMLFQPVQAQKTDLKFANTRLTFGEFGATRADAKFLPGDTFYLAFDIEGIQVNSDGKVAYTMGMELLDAKNASVFAQKPVEREEYLTLGGNRLPARAFLNIGTTQAPGVYTCKIEVFDRGTGQRRSLEQKIEILTRNLGLVNVLYSHDQNGELGAPPAGVVGQTMWLQCTIIGFERSPVKKQPQVDLEMAAYEKGVKILKEPIKITIEDKVGADAALLPVQFLVPLSRPGDFTLELKVTDKVSKKVSAVTLPLRVSSATDR